MSSLKTSNIKQCNDDNDCSKFNKFKIKYHCDKVKKICTKQRNSISFSNDKVHIINSLFIDEFLKNITFYNIDSNSFLRNLNKYIVKLNELELVKKQNKDANVDEKTLKKQEEKEKNIILKLKEQIQKLPKKIEEYKNKIDNIDYFFKSIKQLPTGSTTGLSTSEPDENHIIIKNIQKKLIYRNSILLHYNQKFKTYFKK